MKRDWLFRETDADLFVGTADVRNTASIKVLQRIGMIPTEVKANESGMLCQYHIMRRPA